MTRPHVQQTKRLFIFPLSHAHTKPLLTMPSILSTSQNVVLATVMAAVSCTVILLTFRHQKITHTPRPCLSSDGCKRGKKKRVHFAKDVVEPSGNGVEFRKRHRKVAATKTFKNDLSNDDDDGGERKEVSGKVTGLMPANRVALYNGMLRDRVVRHRFGYSC